MSQRPSEPGPGPDPEPRFVVFEGGEGSGKSTQVRRLAERLVAEGLPAPLLTREPGATPVGAAIRDLLLHAATDIDPKAEALLYAADRADHVATVIRPALDRGAIVISDRYVDSSVAYQGAGRTLDVEDVAGLSRWATGGLVPGLTVVLDIDPVEGLARAGQVDAPDRLESEPRAFHERVREGFLSLAAADPDRYVVIDATLDADTVAARVADAVLAVLNRVDA